MTRVRLRQCPWGPHLSCRRQCRRAANTLPHHHPSVRARALARTRAHPRTLSLSRARRRARAARRGRLALAPPPAPAPPLSRALLAPAWPPRALPPTRPPPPARAPASAVNARGRGQKQKETDLEKRKKARAPETLIRAPHRARTSPSPERDPQRLNPDLDWVRVRHSESKVA